METIGSTGMWVGFAVFVVIATAIDLLLLRGQGDKPVSMRAALGWSAVWVAVAGVFAAGLWWHLDGSAAGRSRTSAPASSSPAISSRNRSRWTTSSCS